MPACLIADYPMIALYSSKLSVCANASDGDEPRLDAFTNALTGRERERSCTEKSATPKRHGGVEEKQPFDGQNWIFPPNCKMRADDAP